MRWVSTERIRPSVASINATSAINAKSSETPFCVRRPGGGEVDVFFLAPDSQTRARCAAARSCQIFGSDTAATALRPDRSDGQPDALAGADLQLTGVLANVVALTSHSVGWALRVLFELVAARDERDTDGQHLFPRQRLWLAKPRRDDEAVAVGVLMRKA